MKLSEIFEKKTPNTMVRNRFVNGYEKWTLLSDLILNGHTATTFFGDERWDVANSGHHTMDILIELKQAASKILALEGAQAKSYEKNLGAWSNLQEQIEQAEAHIGFELEKDKENQFHKDFFDGH